MDKVGGYEAMVDRFLSSASTNSYLQQGLYNNISCGFPPDDSFHIFRGLESAYPWPGLTFGLTLIATYYFCNNQVFSLTFFPLEHNFVQSLLLELGSILRSDFQIIVQRNLAAKSVSHSKAACVLASYLKILPFFLFTWPGMISRILFPGQSPLHLSLL